MYDERVCVTARKSKGSLGSGIGSCWNQGWVQIRICMEKFGVFILKIIKGCIFDLYLKSICIYNQMHIPFYQQKVKHCRT